jgi:hypothetical protein
MAPRALSDGTLWRSAGRAATLLTVLGLSAGASSADAGIRVPANDAALAVELVKPPHSDLRICWSALLHEDGGEFLLTRLGPGGFASEVARVRPRGEGRYQVTEPGAAGAWTYRLQYRDRRGRDHLLATIRLNVETVQSGRGLLTAAGHVQPAAVRTAAVLPNPQAGPTWPATAESAAAGPARRPAPSPP